MVINNEILTALIHCNYKAYLKGQNFQSSKSDFEIVINELKEIQKQNYYAKNLVNQEFKNQLFNDKDHYELNQIYIDTTFKNDKINIKLDGFYFVEKKMLPILISPLEKVTKIDKLTIALQSHFIQGEFKLNIDSAKIVFGKQLKETKLKLPSFQKEIRQIISSIKNLENAVHPPVFYKNTHCQVCEFNKDCLEKLRERDDLSLLGNLKEKEIEQKNNRGIFSVKQLSYTFRPKKNPYRKRKFLPELKALAIREQKTFIQVTPDLKQAETEVFLDFEGIPDRNSNYLIGLILRQGKTEKEFSFWANNQIDEINIFIELIELLKSLNSFTIYHYGSYEIQALKKISNQLSVEHQVFLKTIIDNSFNVLNIFLNNIYPPTYSNSLKEIARFLKFDWTDKDASGLQSTVWRYNWEMSNNDELKNKLITYNLEDCKALMTIIDWVVGIERKIRDDTNLDFAKTIDIQNDSYHKWGNTKFELPEFDQINSFSHFDYQQKKIFLKSNKILKKAILKKQSSFVNKIDKTVQLYPQKCPSCNQLADYFDLIKKGEQLSIDLQFTKNGIRKRVTLYRGGRYRCCSCKAIFSPHKLKKSPHYEDNIITYAMSLYIQYNVSFKKVSNIIMDTLNIRTSVTKIQEFKHYMAEKYRETYNEIKMQILNGSLIHVDETKANIKDVPSGYVWVFTNMDSVFYLFKRNREADFLKDFLKNFKGVLVSDFYAGYDSLLCPQQKCLVHLMRDLNNDLLNNQLNMAFKNMVCNFGELLRKIMDTVNKYGLKKRNLNKHNKDVDRFYSSFINKHYDDELLLSYQKRFQKNKDKLFTFLDYDCILWNNNNAEHAIKPFAYYRRDNEKQITESSINDYLVLLSIQQTCIYRGINFFDFLKSGKNSIYDRSKK